MNKTFKIIGIVILVIIGIFLIIQVIPYGKPASNPPVLQEPQWDSPETRQLVVGACFDCHSNETIWPWYSRIAPVSWLVANDVKEGRSRLNFSEWNKPQRETDEIAEVVNSGEMPPFYYVMMHKSANLTQAEKQALINGLNATPGLGGEGGGDD